MKQLIVCIMTAIVITACSSKPTDVQADPRSVAEAIFDAAQSGNCEGLAILVDTEADGDSKRIAQVATDKSMQEDFKKYFAKGKVAADPVITGDKASVNILFGPDGSKEETFEMVRKDGKWYLSSF
jgi:hypothetical protein